MKWSWFKVPVKVEQINEYLFSDTIWYKYTSRAHARTYNHYSILNYKIKHANKTSELSDLTAYGVYMPRTQRLPLVGPKPNQRLSSDGAIQIILLTYYLLIYLVVLNINFKMQKSHNQLGQ